MNYEEKYKKAFEIAKNWYVDAQIDFKKSLETLFPELKESEDEKIQWKPSNKQMEEIKAVERFCAAVTSSNAYRQRIVEPLYNELKKLKEDNA